VAAHDADGRHAADELVEGIGDRVVVDRPQQGDERVALVLGVA
jgi:hypothetical protein